MNRSHSLAFREIPQSKPRLENKNQRSKLALRCLRGRLAPRKEWAQKVGVSTKMVDDWVNGIKAISEKRVHQILWIAKELAVEVSQLTDEIDLALIATYGPNVDQGVF